MDAARQREVADRGRRVSGYGSGRQRDSQELVDLSVLIGVSPFIFVGITIFVHELVHANRLRRVWIFWHF